MVKITGTATIEVDDSGFSGTLEKDILEELDNQEFYKILYPRPFVDAEGLEIPASYGEVDDAINELEADDEIYDNLVDYLVEAITDEVGLSCDVTIDEIHTEVYLSKKEYNEEMHYIELRKKWLDEHVTGDQYDSIRRSKTTN